MITLQLLDSAGLAWAQDQVAEHHYLHTRMDPRTMPMGYSVHLSTRHGTPLARPLGRVGLLLFGRPECTRLYPWFGGLDDVASGRTAHTRWEVINLARVWLDPMVQAGGAFCTPNWLPGFYDRRCAWRSSLASTVIRMALAEVPYHYLTQWPLVFPDQPYELRWCLSYCDRHYHRGTIYGASGFELYRSSPRKDEAGRPYDLQTWRIPLRPLTEGERAIVLSRATTSLRSQRIRGRASQLALV